MTSSAGYGLFDGRWSIQSTPGVGEAGASLVGWRVARRIVLGSSSSGRFRALSICCRASFASRCRTSGSWSRTSRLQGCRCLATTKVFRCRGAARSTVVCCRTRSRSTVDRWCGCTGPIRCDRVRRSDASTEPGYFAGSFSLGSSSRSNSSGFWLARAAQLATPSGRDSRACRAGSSPRTSKRARAPCAGRPRGTIDTTSYRPRGGTASRVSDRSGGSLLPRHRAR